MNLGGISDSIADALHEPTVCDRCGSVSHVAPGLCVHCVLQNALSQGGDEGGADAFEAALDQIDVRDVDWRLGNYQILEEIGRGGMGVIYRARQRHSRRIVAVKRLQGYHADSRDTLVRFRREAEAAASLDHPNILPIYEVGDGEDGLPFFSMKFAPGGNLQEAAPALRSDPRKCVALVAKITRAVQYTHGKGILHRDLKPANILLDGSGEPLVSDFGLAKWLDTTSDLTRTLTVFGTPGYIAPEQASGQSAQLEPTADVYSLGAILFDLLAGRPPFLGSHALSVIKQAAETPAPKLRSLSKVADRDLETICARCLERDPSARYHSAHDLAEDLERWLEGRPIIARPVSVPVRVWRWSKRTPLLASSIAACAALAAVAVTWQVHNRDLKAAAHQQEIARHTVVVVPFLNLDDATDETEAPACLARTFDRALKRVGPGRVVSVVESDKNMKGIADLKALATQYNAELLICGTYRSLGDGRERLSLRVVDPAGDVLIRKIIEREAGPRSLDEALDQSAAAVYSLFVASGREHAINSQLDPALRNEEATEFILAGRELMERQTVADLDRALKCFERARSIEPLSALGPAYFAITAATRLHYKFEQHLLDEAMQSARLAATLNPDLPEVHRALAGMAHRRGDLARALDEAYQSIELGGPQVPMLALIGGSLKAIGEPHRAIAWFEKMAQWRRRPADDSWMIGDCWADLVHDERAEANYRRVSDLHPDLPEGWLGLCHLRCLNQDFAAARAILAQQSARYQDHSYTKQMAAQVELFAREFVEAERLYTELAANDPGGGSEFYGTISYQSALGMLLLERGDIASGRRVLEEALSKTRPLLEDPHHPDVLYLLAAIESSLGATDEALSYLHEAFASGWIDYRSMALDPRFDRVRQTQRYQTIFDGMRKRVASLRVAALQKDITK